MMRFILLSIFCLSGYSVFCQISDGFLLSHETATGSPFNHPEVKYKVSVNPVVFAGKTALFFYQKVISNQIGAVCAHEPSCSEYCRQSIEKSGFICGILLSGDRLHRCTVFNVMQERKNPENLRNGKIYDPVK
jgi:putative component of membrane protein insertase Oxa1/YidC/SpoIIIJ protein YidD